MDPARMGSIQRDFMPEDLAPLLAAAGFSGSVAVQASQTPAETLFLLSLAEAPGSTVRGVVGWCDLRAAPEALAAELAALTAQHPRLVGMRHVVHDEPDDAFLLRDDVRRGIAMLAGAGLAFDRLLVPRHLAPACAVVADNPQLTFVLDHIAKPHIAQCQAAALQGKPREPGALEPPEWEADLRRLASFRNVACKVSGMVTEAKWGEFKNVDFFAFLDVVFDAFGKDRVMIGSDWPVATLSASYGDTMAVVRAYMAAREFSSAEEEAVLGGTCARVYKLPGL
jgi:L-fuconolactonase